MKVLRTAVIGLGRIGWGWHIPEINRHDGFELVSAMDTNLERLAELKEKYGVNGYTDLKEMMDAEKPDLVVVASPTHLHKEHIITAMEYGADVFSDKPVAKNIAEVHEIYEASKRLGRKIMVYQPHRVNAICNTFKKILKEGKIGPLFMLKRANSDYCRRNDWQALKEYGGGMINNYGAHFIDQMRYIVEEDINIKTCMCRTVATLGDADDVVKVVMESESGIMLDLDINQAAGYQIIPWMAFGKYGSIKAYQEYGKGDDYVFHVKYIIPEECPPLEMQTGLAAEQRKYSVDLPLPWHEEIVPIVKENEIDFYEKCYDFFALDEEPFVPFEQTVRLMTLIDECRTIAGV